MQTLVTESERTKFEKLEAAAAMASAARQALSDSIADREGQWHSLCELLTSLSRTVMSAHGGVAHADNQIEELHSHARATIGRNDGEHLRICREIGQFQT